MSLPPLSCTMPVKKAEEMEKTSRSKTRGRSCRETSEKEERVSHTPLVPAKGPGGGNRQSLEVAGSQVSEILEHPRTPVPWTRQRSNRLRQEPAAGEGSTFSHSPNLCEERETAAMGGGGDRQTWQTESIKQVKKKPKSLYLKPPDRAQAANILENFLGHFLTYLHECPDRPYFKDIKELVPGSSYEYETLLHPGVFDVPLSIPLPDYVQYTEVEGYNGLFYTLTLLRKSFSFPAALLLEDRKTISPRNIMEEFWKHVDQFVKVFYSVPFPGWQMRLEKNKPNCPAVSLVMLDNQGAKFMSVNLVPALEMVAQWPCVKAAKELLAEEELLHLMQVFYFVAKQSPGRHNKETWRISYSHVEKEILNRHRSSEACYRYHRMECCRKVCLKMLEDRVKTLKMEYPQMMAHLSSYHALTSFLHTLWEWKTDADWKPSDVAQCFKRVLGNFIHEVATAHLTHFFLPKCNLFGAKFFPPTKLKFLWSHLKVKEGIAQAFTVPRKRGCSALCLNPDMIWPLVITCGLIVLVSVVLPHMVA